LIPLPLLLKGNLKDLQLKFSTPAAVFLNFNLILSGKLLKLWELADIMLKNLPMKVRFGMV
jgi:hypothetical protein